MTTLDEPRNNGEREYNVFRDPPLRYAGYANEVGESFRYKFPLFVVPSFALAVGYCFADASASGWKAYTCEHRSKTSDNDNVTNAVGAFADTLLWQRLASVMIPRACINMVVRAAQCFVQTSPPGRIPTLLATWVPTDAGLGSIPLIIHPIDHSVDYLLNRLIRPLWKNSA